MHPLSTQRLAPVPNASANYQRTLLPAAATAALVSFPSFFIGVLCYLFDAPGRKKALDGTLSLSGILDIVRRYQSSLFWSV
jgi:hypothetical protein